MQEKGKGSDGQEGQEEKEVSYWTQKASASQATLSLSPPPAFDLSQRHHHRYE